MVRLPVVLPLTVVVAVREGDNSFYECRVRDQLVSRAPEAWHMINTSFDQTTEHTIITRVTAVETALTLYE